MRRSDHPSRPSARICCCLSSSKTLLMPATELAFRRRRQRLDRYREWPVFSCRSMAGFGCPPRPIGTCLYGRRLHETMAYWDVPVEGYPPEDRDFARIWQRAEKIVFSRTLTGATTRNTHVERDFDLEAYSKAQAGIGARHQHWRRRACGACARSRSRRRMSPVSQPGDRRRRKAGIPSRLTTESRTP